MAKAHITHLRATDREIERLNMQLSIAQTARSAYALGLKQALSAQPESD